MKKRLISVILSVAMTAALLAGCGNSGSEQSAAPAESAAEKTENAAASTDGVKITVLNTKSEIQPPQYIAEDSVVERSIIGEGTDIYGKVYNSVIGCGVTIGKGTVVRDSIIMNHTQIGDGCELYKAIVAENVQIGHNVKLGVGEAKENDTAPHIYNHGIVTIGEKSVIPNGISVGKNSVISGVTSADDYEGSYLASGKTLIKAGE